MGTKEDLQEYTDQLVVGSILQQLSKFLPIDTINSVGVFVDHSISMEYGYDKKYNLKFRKLANMLATTLFFHITNCRLFSYSSGVVSIEVADCTRPSCVLGALEQPRGHAREHPEEALMWLATNQIPMQKLVFISDNTHSFKTRSFRAAVEEYRRKINPAVDVVIICLDYTDNLLTEGGEFCRIIRGFSDDILKFVFEV